VIPRLRELFVSNKTDKEDIVLMHKELADCLGISSPQISYYRKHHPDSYRYLIDIGCGYTSDRYAVQRALTNIFFNEEFGMMHIFREVAYKTFNSYHHFYHRISFRVIHDKFNVVDHLQWKKFLEDYEKWYNSEKKETNGN
jgi:hypothetical protein